MTTPVTAHGGNIDQRGMSADERLDLAKVLHDGWWDCHRAFMRVAVDIDSLGLSAASLAALADDLEEAGYESHASAVRGFLRPQDRSADRPVLTRWRPRVHQGSGVRSHA